MRTIDLIPLLSLLYGCSAPVSDDTGPSVDTAETSDTGIQDSESRALDLSKIRAKILSEMDDKLIPGLAVTFVIGDEVVWSEGFGFANVEDEVPVTDRTPFMLASVSKTFTGTALMQAIEADALDLQTPVNDLLDFEVNNPRVEGDTIEVQHLVTHTSGIRDNWSVWDDFNLYSEGDSPISLPDFLREFPKDF